MAEKRKPVVAGLNSSRETYPFSSIALSPDRQHAIAAGKDTLRVLSVSPKGLTEIQSLRISQHFQGSVAGTANAPHHSRYGDVRDTFGLYKPPVSAQNMGVSNSSNVVVTDVAWSAQQLETEGRVVDTSVVAAAGSNGVVVLWPAANALLNTPSGYSSSSSSSLAPSPEMILTQHSRAVNRLAWHPSAKRPGYLLTGSQDATVILWERRLSAPGNQSPGNPVLRTWFGRQNFHPSLLNRSCSWHCLATYNPKSEAVRDIKWSPFHDDLFGLVTESGSLIVYNIQLSGAPWFRVSAHDRESTTLDWHPVKPYVVATGGAGDRSVKVWDLENIMTPEFSGESKSNASDESTSRIGLASRSLGASPTQFSQSGRGNKNSSANLLYVLSVSASVTRLLWRPPAGRHVDVNIHEWMLAVATLPVKGASAGGNGVLGLWSRRRPYMALSVVEGHSEGAVTDFVWLDTPSGGPEGAQPSGQAEARKSPAQESMGRELIGQFQSVDAHTLSTEGTWQHVLSVGRDGMCLLQSFARGDRPISRVPPSCFALANLSPFQRGYGSLQVFSVHQKVPSGPDQDFSLTGLRRDLATSRALGVFREPNEQQEAKASVTGPSPTVLNQRLPSTPPAMVFNVIDQGDLDEDLKPVESHPTMIVAPEVVHLSRFANLYKLYTDASNPTRASLCLHNASIAQRLRRDPLARMWGMVATLLKGAGLDQLPQKGSSPANALQFALLPSIRELLYERANAGDVQTCVALCEILQVVKSDSSGTVEICIPNLELELVREWYLSYIDLLQQMCLFSHATALIRRSEDPMIGALNQKSTTIHESCPHCGKAIESVAASDDQRGGVARRTCNKCRRRIGLCFICHEPVKGLFVWCPGCGHGGHLDHALEWFGGLGGKAVREFCPTGCGHKCNLTQQLSAFPIAFSSEQQQESHQAIDNDYGAPKFCMPARKTAQPS